MNRFFVALLMVLVFAGVAQADQITRPDKAAGGQEFADGAVIQADDFNDDWDAIVDVVNGNLDNDNIQANARIDVSKLGDIPASKIVSGRLDVLRLPSTFNATTATRLAADPADCGSGQFARSINALGNLSCATPATGSDDQTASEVPVSSSGFNGQLSSSDNSVQKVAQKFDDYTPTIPDPVQVGSTYTRTSNTAQNTLYGTGITLPSSGWVLIVLSCGQPVNSGWASVRFPVTLLTSLAATTDGTVRTSTISISTATSASRTAYLGRTMTNELLMGCSSSNTDREVRVYQ